MRGSSGHPLAVFAVNASHGIWASDFNGAANLAGRFCLASFALRDCSAIVADNLVAGDDVAPAIGRSGFDETHAGGFLVRAENARRHALGPMPAFGHDADDRTADDCQ